MKYSLVSILALLAACGGPASNSNPDTTPDVITTPDTMVPDAGTPDTLGIDTQKPDTTPITPDTGTPDTQVPDTLVPDTQKPDTLVPDTMPTTDAPCPAGLYGPKCNLSFDPTQFTASKVFCPADSGKLEISGRTGSESYLNGYYVDLQVGTVDRCVWIIMSPALGTNLPSPTTGKIVAVAHGIEVQAIDKEQPFLADGTGFNTMQPLKKVDIFFNNNRGQVSLLESGKFTILETTILQKGTLGKTQHFSAFYLDVDNPVVVASASHVGNREVLIDFSGTVHAGSTTPYLLQFSALEGGTPLALTAADSTGLVFRTTLAGGAHVLSATVADQYGDIASKQVNVTVDLCSSVTCQPWQTCRATDGVCVGSDPCAPNPCVHGTCSSVTGSAVCTSCADGWKGTLCDQVDLCFGNTCSGNGTCDASNGVCKCDSGWLGSSCESDDPCLPNPCGNGGSCSVSGTSAVCACTGNWNSATSCTTCTGNWDQSTSCTSCTSGWTGTDCNTPVVVDPCAGITCSNHGTCGGGTCSCSTGYTGSTCNTCAAGYQGYPTCVPIPPPAPTISGLGIDCGSEPCWAGGNSYTVTFTATNATSCTASATRISGLGTSGSTSSCVISGNSGSFTYNTGDTAGDVTQITVSVSGPGGSTSASTTVTLE